MSRVSQTHNFIYVSGGRCATGAINAALEKIPNVKSYDPAKKNNELWKKYDKHMPARYIRNHVGEEIYNRCFKFTFVRNTYSWVTSSYFFWVKIGRYKMPKNGIMDMKCFEETVKYYKTNIGRRYDECSNIRSQHSYICDEESKIILDYVGRFEQLQKDFDVVCRKINNGITIPLTVQNKSYASKEDWKNHYRMNPEAKEYVYQNWKRDIDAFGFKLEL